MEIGDVTMKKQGEFPYIQVFKAKFPVTDDTIFVYRDTIYTKDEPPYDVIFHEIRHLQRQKEIGADSWIDQYLNNEEFRLNEEVIAYRYQLKKVLELTKDRNEYFNIMTESARNLSSKLYGNIIKYQKAVDLLSIK